MAARAHSHDPRAERVRAKIREAAFALARERRVDEITVSDLVQRAEVSRQAFYQHYEDRDDAVAAAVTAAFTAATSDAGADPTGRILRLFEFAAEHRAMYRNIVPSTVSLRAAAAFRAQLAPPCREIAAQGTPAVSAVAGVTAESVAGFLIGGFMEVLRSWMEDPAPSDLRSKAGAALDTVAALLGTGDRHPVTTH
jgi:AcrR family transcriptional regulator